VIAKLGQIVPRDREVASLVVSHVVLAEARTHTPRPIGEKMLREACFRPELTGIMGPGFRQDDSGELSRQEGQRCYFDG